MIEESTIVDHHITFCSLLHLLIMLEGLCLIPDMLRELLALSYFLCSPISLLLQLNFQDLLKLGTGLWVLKLHLRDHLTKWCIFWRSSWSKLINIVCSLHVDLHQPLLGEKRPILHAFLGPLEHL